MQGCSTSFYHIIILFLNAFNITRKSNELKLKLLLNRKQLACLQKAIEKVLVESRLKALRVAIIYSNDKRILNSIAQ